QSVITELREIRAGMKLDPKKKIAAEFSSEDDAVRTLVVQNRAAVLRLAMLSDIQTKRGHLPAAGGMVRSTAQFDVRVAFAEGLNAASEAAKLRKEIERLEKDIAVKEQRLADKTFRSKAPPQIVKGLEATLAERQLEYEKLKNRFSQLDADA